MTNDKANALLVHVQDLRDSGFKSVSISPTDLIALLAERERLRGALEEAADALDAAYLRTMSADDLAAYHIARQALEAPTHDQ